MTKKNRSRAKKDASKLAAAVEKLSLTTDIPVTIPKNDLEIWNHFKNSDIALLVDLWPTNKAGIDVTKAKAALGCFLNQTDPKLARKDFDKVLELTGLVLKKIYTKDSARIDHLTGNISSIRKLLYNEHGGEPTWNFVTVFNDFRDHFDKFVESTGALKAEEDRASLPLVTLVDFDLTSNKYPWAASRLYDQLNEMARLWKSTEYFSPQTALIQSSGVGKSFQSLWIGLKHCFEFYICCREGGSGYPPRSVVTDFIANPYSFKGPLAILENKETSNLNEVEAVEKSYKRSVPLAALFCACVKSLLLFCRAHKTLDLQTLRTKWLGFQMEPTPLPNRKVWGHDFWTRIISSTLEIVGEAVNEVGFTNPTVNFNDLYKYLRQLMSDYTRKLEALFKTEKLILFVFDEASRLEVAKEGNLRAVRNALTVFRDVESVKSLAMFGLFLDTFGTVSTLAPSGEEESSFRGMTKHSTFAPLSFLHFDRGKMPFWWTESDPVEMEKQLLKMLRRQGRLLWSGMTYQDPGLMLEFAATKLIKRAPNFHDNAQFSNASALAILASRVLINFSVQKVLNEELVSSHMASCHNITVYNESGKTGEVVYEVSYPSEPMLSNAAYYVSHVHRSPYSMSACVNALFWSISRGQVDRGYLGELIGRIIMIDTYDRAYATIPRPVSRLVVPITLKAFLEKLGANVVTKIGDSAIDRDLGEESSKLLDGKVYFTHFAHVNYLVSFERLYLFFGKGRAIMCKPNQPEIDMIIPVYLGEAPKDEGQTKVDQMNQGTMKGGQKGDNDQDDEVDQKDEDDQGDEDYQVAEDDPVDDDDQEDEDEQEDEDGTKNGMDKGRMSFVFIQIKNHETKKRGKAVSVNPINCMLFKKSEIVPAHLLIHINLLPEQLGTSDADVTIIQGPGTDRTKEEARKKGTRLSYQLAIHMSGLDAFAINESLQHELKGIAGIRQNALGGLEGVAKSMAMQATDPEYCQIDEAGRIADMTRKPKKANFQTVDFM